MQVGEGSEAHCIQRGCGFGIVFAQAPMQVGEGSKTSNSLVFLAFSKAFLAFYIYNIATRTIVLVLVIKLL